MYKHRLKTNQLKERSSSRHRLWKEKAAAIHFRHKPIEVSANKNSPSHAAATCSSLFQQSKAKKVHINAYRKDGKKSGARILKGQNLNSTLPPNSLPPRNVLSPNSLQTSQVSKFYRFLFSNNFTGELPNSFTNLTTLIEFQINDNQFTGSIPPYIQNWKNLTQLWIQASGLNGLIPSIALLETLTDLRISNLNGSEDQRFPPLNNLVKLERLIYRS